MFFHKVFTPLHYREEKKSYHVGMRVSLILLLVSFLNKMYDSNTCVATLFYVY